MSDMRDYKCPYCHYLISRYASKTTYILSEHDRDKVSVKDDGTAYARLPARQTVSSRDGAAYISGMMVDVMECQSCGGMMMFRAKK